MNDQLDHDTSIDRLAAGELDGPARSELFSWLDAKPARWRRCALALLEARELDEAFGSWRGDVPQRVVQESPTRAAQRSARGAVLALAASILVAFGLGVMARGVWPSGAPQVAASPEPAPKTVDESPLVGTRTPVSKPAERSVGDREQSTERAETLIATAVASEQLLPPYVRSQWERRGYHVTSQRVKLPVVLPDGHRALLPANELQFNYVGKRTY